MMVNLAWQHGRVGRREYFGDYAVDFAKAFDVVRDHFGTAVPLLAAGMHVVTPRSAYCRLATSIGMGGFRDKRIEQVLSLIPDPDLLFWIDIEPELALARITARGIDSEDLDFLRAFCFALRGMPEARGWIRIDGDQAIQQVSQEIREHVRQFFEKRAPG
jgi:thymidylate kinase